MSLSYQEKLALMMTAAHSQRTLAAAIGVTHQKLGRWLREGEDKGVRKIPEEAFGIIDAVFSIYVDIVKENAHHQRIPFIKSVPVMMVRRLKRDGTLSDKVVVEHTQFIRRGLRVEFFTSLIHTEAFYTGSVRSTIDLYAYSGMRVEKMIESGAIQRGSKSRSLKRDVHAFMQREGLTESTVEHPLFTPYENISYQMRTRPDSAAFGIEQKLREKHEPATGTGKTALADMYLMQLLPEDYKRPDITVTKRRNERSNRSASKRTRGAGPK